MGRRAASWLAWSLGLLSVVLLSASAILLVLNSPTRVVEGAGVWGTANAPFRRWRLGYGERPLHRPGNGLDAGGRPCCVPASR
jgi:hypothetical protein